MRSTTTATARMSPAPWRRSRATAWPSPAWRRRRRSCPVKVLDCRRARAATSMSPRASSGRPITARASSTSASAAARPSTVLADAVAYARGKGVLIVAAAGNDGGHGGRARPPRRSARGRRRRLPRSCARRSAPVAARSISSRRASASCSRRSTAPAAMPTAPSRAPPWRTPHVAGVAALALAAGPRDDGDRRLAPAHADGARSRPVPGRDSAYGAGLVRADAALGAGGTLSACRVERPPSPQIARAQWLLGLDAPESTGGDPPRLEGAGRAHASRPQRRARRTPPRASPLRSTRRASCASGGSRRASRGRSRWLPRRCARPSPSASCARRRARPSRTAPRSAPATSSRGWCRGAIPPRSPCSRCARAERTRTRGSSSTTARSPPRPISCRSPTAAPCAAVQRSRRRAPGAAAVSPVPRGARAARALGARGRARAARHPLARPGGPGDGCRARRLRARGARARALPLGRGGRAPAARGAPGQHAGRLRARLRAVGGGLHGARRRTTSARLEAPQAP